MYSSHDINEAKRQIEEMGSEKSERMFSVYRMYVENLNLSRYEIAELNGISVSELSNLINIMVKGSEKVTDIHRLIYRFRKEYRSKYDRPREFLNIELIYSSKELEKARTDEYAKLDEAYSDADTIHIELMSRYNIRIIENNLEDVNTIVKTCKDVDINKDIGDLEDARFEECAEEYEETTVEPYDLVAVVEEYTKDMESSYESIGSKLCMSEYKVAKLLKFAKENVLCSEIQYFTLLYKPGFKKESWEKHNLDFIEVE